MQFIKITDAKISSAYDDIRDADDRLIVRTTFHVCHNLEDNGSAPGSIHCNTMFSLSSHLATHSEDYVFPVQVLSPRLVLNGKNKVTHP